MTILNLTTQSSNRETGNVLYALWGKEQTGKTDVIRLVYKMLRDHYPTAMVSHLVDNDGLRAVMSIGKVKIGIESHSCDNQRQNDSLQLFLASDCKIIICATQTNGKTVETVHNLGLAYELEWFAQLNAPPEQRNERNNQVAQEIVVRVAKVVG